MKKNRRDFLKVAGAAGIGMIGAGMLVSLNACNEPSADGSAAVPVDNTFDSAKESIIVLYDP